MRIYSTAILGKIRLMAAVFLTTAPLLVFAAPPANFKELINKIIGYANTFGIFFLGLAVLGFLWGVLKYVAAGSDEKKLAEGRAVIGYGLVAIFVMVSFFGLALIIKRSFFE